MEGQDSGLFGDGLDADMSAGGGAFGSSDPPPIMSFDSDNSVPGYGSDYGMFSSQGNSFYSGAGGQQPKQISGSAMQTSGDMEPSLDAEYDAILNAQNRKRKHPTGGFGETNGEYPDISSPRMLHMPFTHTGAPSMVSGSIMGLHTQHQLSGSGGGGQGGAGMMPQSHSGMMPGDVIKSDPNNTSGSSTTSAASMNGVHGGYGYGDGSPAGTQTGISSSTASISNAMSMLDVVGSGGSGSNGNVDQKVNSMIVASDADNTSNGGDSEPLTPAYVPTETRIMANHTSKVLVCAFDMSGKYLATGGGGMDPPIRIWDMSTGEIHMMLKGHTHNVTGLRWSTNAQSPFLLLSCSLDSTIRLWDISNTDNPEVNVVRHSAQLNALDWHPSSVDRFVCTDHSENLVFWYMKDALGIVAQPTGQMSGVSNKQVRYSPSGRYIAAGLFNQGSSLKIIDADQQKVLFDLSGHERQIIGIWWIDDSLLVSTSEDVVRVWKLSGSSVDCIRQFSAPGDKTYYAIAHPKTPSRILVGAFQKIYDWDYSNNKHRSIPCHEGIVSCLSYSSQSDILSTTSHDKLVKLWKIGSS
jgi:WD40 repeat protein